MAVLNCNLIDKIGDRVDWNWWGHATATLHRHLEPVVKKTPGLSISVWWCPEGQWNDKPLGIDMNIFVVTDVRGSVIAEKGGDVSRARQNSTILGLTDLNRKICEVYFDRAFDRSFKEVAGAAFHEAAHLKSNMDDSMHNGQDGLLSERPFLAGGPTQKNIDFLAQHITRVVI